MLRLFGEVWWDYREKPFNYQGIICLESTIAWGFYAVIIIGYLHQAVMDVASWYTSVSYTHLVPAGPRAEEDSCFFYVPIFIQNRKGLHFWKDLW